MPVPIGEIHAQTQAEMNAVAREDLARADADLNKTYHAVLAKLGDTPLARCYPSPLYLLYS
jgi:uncharacterized protein YecT (DUF1311 family)